MVRDELFIRFTRERVIRFMQRGGRKALAARLYEVTRFTVYYWLKKKANTGSLVDYSILY